VRDNPRDNPRLSPYEPILVPDNLRVVGTARDQATRSLDRALLPVEPESPNPFGQRVYIDTQATAEPKNAAMEQAITEQMTASRYEEGNAEPGTPTAIEVQGTQAGGVTRPSVSPAVTAAGTALQEKTTLFFHWVEPRLPTLSPDQYKLVADLEMEIRALFQGMTTTPAEQWLVLARKASSDIDAVQAALTSTASTSWLLIGVAAVGAWLLLRK